MLSNFIGGNIMKTALIILQIVVSIALVLIVLFQEGKSAGLSGTIAGGAETFFGKNKGRSIDGLLKKLTAVLAVVFLVTSVLLSIL